MKTYIIRRLLLMPLTLLGVTFLVFCITRFVPGGPIEQMMQQQSMSALSGQGAHALLLHHLLNGTSRNKTGYAKDEKRNPQERQGHEKESSDDIGLHSSR